MRPGPFISLVLLAGCGNPAAPVQPSPSVAVAPQFLSFEAEAGSGDGPTMQRPKASGGLTIHLAPGERRQWAFNVDAAQAQYAIAVTYANDNIGATETLHVTLDGQAIGSFQARDTGDDGEGWNIFMTDLAGHSVLARGSHTLVVSSSGGDGCVEIDKVTLTP
jgi:hypothetical protein